MKKFVALFLLLFLVLLPASLFAMDKRVFVKYRDLKSMDSVGQRLVTAVVGRVRDEPSFRFAFEQTFGLIVSIETSVGDNNDRGKSTIYGVSWLWYNPDQFAPFYLGTAVGTCKAGNIGDCADDILAATRVVADKMYAAAEREVEEQSRKPQ